MIKMYDLYKILRKSLWALDIKNPVPLKKKSTRELIEFTGLDPMVAHYFLLWYRKQERYLRIIKEGRNVYDLYGIITGTVTKEEELRAQEKIKKLREEYAKKSKSI
jgi:hypothetical protein